MLGLSEAFERLGWDFSCNLGTLLQVGVAFGFGWLMWKLQERYVKLQDKYIEIMKFLQDVEAKRAREANHKTKFDIYHSTKSIAIRMSNRNISSDIFTDAEYLRSAAHMFFEPKTAIIVDDICSAIGRYYEDEKEAVKVKRFQEWVGDRNAFFKRKVIELRDSALQYDGLFGDSEYQSIRTEEAQKHAGE